MKTNASRVLPPGRPAMPNAPAGKPQLHWQWRRLLTAPHRLGFFAGALMFATSALWWALVQLAGAAGLGLPWAVPPNVAHGLLMGHGFMPLFFSGFLFTAGPKWMGMPPAEARAILVPVLALVAGWLLFVAGVHAHTGLAALGVASAAVGWGAVTVRFGRLVVHSRVADKVHATLVLAACSVGMLALAAAAVGLATGATAQVRAATQWGLWGGIAVVFVTVVHRMVPFFSASAVPVLDAWRPMWLLWLLVGGVAAEAPLVAMDLLGAGLPPAARVSQAAVELAMALLLLWLAVRWGIAQNLRIRLLAMLHLGFFWLGISFLLQAASHTLQAVGAAGLGAAPLHALTTGFLGSTLLAMVTRVSAGHSGRAVAADDVAWGLFWGLQVAVVARSLAALWPPAAGLALPVGALAWAAVAVAWALRHGRWYGRARVDGRPG